MFWPVDVSICLWAITSCRSLDRRAHIQFVLYDRLSCRLVAFTVFHIRTSESNRHNQRLRAGEIRDYSNTCSHASTAQTRSLTLRISFGSHSPRNERNGSSSEVENGERIWEISVSFICTGLCVERTLIRKANSLLVWIYESVRIRSRP